MKDQFILAPPPPTKAEILAPGEKKKQESGRLSASQGISQNERDSPLENASAYIKEEAPR